MRNIAEFEYVWPLFWIWRRCRGHDEFRSSILISFGQSRTFTQLDGSHEGMEAEHFFWWVLQHCTGFARLVWGRLRVNWAFIYSNWFVCSVCFCSLLPRLTLLMSFLDILHCLPRAVGVPLESALDLVSPMSPCGAHDTHAYCARSNDHLLYLLW